MNVGGHNDEGVKLKPTFAPIRFQDIHHELCRPLDLKQTTLCAYKGQK